MFTLSRFAGLAAVFAITSVMVAANATMAQQSAGGPSGSGASGSGGSGSASSGADPSGMGSGSGEPGGSALELDREPKIRSLAAPDPAPTLTVTAVSRPANPPVRGSARSAPSPRPPVAKVNVARGTEPRIVPVATLAPPTFSIGRTEPYWRL